MNRISLIIFYIIIFFISFLLTTFIHEIGHALIALLGGGSFQIVLGANKNKKGAEILNSKYLKIYTAFHLGGYCNFYFNGKLKYKSEFYKILLHFGGVLIQIIVAIILFKIRYDLSPNIYFHIYRPFQLVNIISALFSLLPIDPEEKGYESDGSKIKNILKNKKASL